MTGTKSKPKTRRKQSDQKRPSPSVRASHNRRVRQDALREKFKAMEYIRQLETDYSELSQIVTKLKALKAKKLTISQAKAVGRLHDYEQARFDKEILVARKDVVLAKIQTNFRRLKFCIPELKAIQLEDPEGKNPFSDFLNFLVEATKDNNK
jgi:hypothetical protein